MLIIGKCVIFVTLIKKHKFPIKYGFIEKKCLRIIKESEGINHEESEIINKEIHEESQTINEENQETVNKVELENLKNQLKDSSCFIEDLKN
jgi:hypothetical protein